MGILRPVLVSAQVARPRPLRLLVRGHPVLHLWRLRIAELIDVVVGAAARISKIAHRGLLAT
jgi:hypothetical protein